ncbi:negative elongation factor D isoform X1 [Hydra vulgaris]|nr:negative elongation factor D-like [Hydra vulgaris]XP_047126702.1 negative elongation factor D-like [Hydra vulgaris]
MSYNEYNEYEANYDDDFMRYPGSDESCSASNEDVDREEWTEQHLESTDDFEFEDKHAVINECKEKMSSKDFIMEPAVSFYIKKFLDAGGCQDDFINLLAENYHGTAQIANLLADWLIVAGASVEEVQEIVETHLRELIVKTFDPKKADSIFSGQPPGWIEEMIAYPPWRAMFYELADKHPDCLMLIFTIKLIADSGYQAEIGSVSSACTQLEVFSKVLTTSILNYFKQGASKNDIMKVCCHSNQLYIYTQCLLHSLCEKFEPEQQRIWIKRLIQNLEIGARSSGNNIWHLVLIFMGCGKYPRIFYSLLSLLGRKALNPGDITVLYKTYSAPEPPPVKFLQIPALIEMLISAIFTCESNMSAENKPKYFFLLAYAVSVYEVWNEDTRDLLYHDELKATLLAIERIHTLCTNNIGVTITQSSFDISVLFQCIRYPVVSIGLIKWIEFCMSEKYYEKVVVEAAPLQIILLDEMSNNHPLQHELIMNLLQNLFERNYPKLNTLVELEFKKTLVDRMVHILSRGYIIPVVVYMKECMNKQITDVSLLRHFVAEVLEMIGPPYSSEFVTSMLPLVKNDEISTLLKTADQQDDVTMFLSHCEVR